MERREFRWQVGRCALPQDEAELDSEYGDDICNSMQRVDNAFQLGGRTVSEFYKIYN